VVSGLCLAACSANPRTEAQRFDQAVSSHSTPPAPPVMAAGPAVTPAPQTPSADLDPGEDDDSFAGVPVSNPGPQLGQDAAPSPAALPWLRMEVPPLMLRAPVGASVAHSHGAAIVSFGAGFSVEVRPGTLDVDRRRRLAEMDSTRPAVSFHSRRGRVLLWEAASPAESLPTEFRFASEIRVNRRSYLCENTSGYRHTLAEAEAMLTACRSLRNADAIIAR